MPGTPGGGGQEPTIAEEFLLAMASYNRVSAEEIISWLNLPPVVVSSYSFGLIKGDEDQAVDQEAR